MKDALARLDQILQHYRNDYYQHLLPGASIADLSALEQQLGLVLPTAFKELYHWKNGQAADEYASFLNNRTWMSLMSIQEAHTTLTELWQAGDFDDPHWWRPAWIPFMEDGAGNHLCLDLEGTFTGRVGQIIEFWHDDADRWVIAPSLEAWLTNYVGFLDATVEQANMQEEVEDLEWEPSIPDYPMKYAAGEM